MILNASFVIFSVYTPRKTQINWYEVDRAYWMEQVFPKLKDFYFNFFLPAAIRKERGILKKGEIEPVFSIDTTFNNAICNDSSRK